MRKSKLRFEEAEEAAASTCACRLVQASSGAAAAGRALEVAVAGCRGTVGRLRRTLVASQELSGRSASAAHERENQLEPLREKLAKATAASSRASADLASLSRTMAASKVG
jgi:ABC-type transporter Mla subunit MlaD